MKNLKIISIAIILIFPVIVFSQQNKIDSLLSLIKKDKQDTNKVIHLYQLIRECELSGGFEEGLNYGIEALELARKLNFKKGIANSYGSIGNIYLGQANYPKAFDYYLKALKLDEELKNKKRIAVRLGNIGLVYAAQSDYDKALDYYFKAEAIAEELGDKSGMSIHFGNIGNIYSYKSDYNKALNYYFKALKIAEELGDKKRIATQLSNIGTVYDQQTDFPKALDYYFKSLKINETLGSKTGLGINISNIGSVYSSQGDKKKALDYYLKALKVYEGCGNKNYIAIQLGNIGNIYNDQANFSKALDYYFKALKINEELGDKNLIANQLGNIGNLYTKTGKFKEAEQYLKKSIAISDSIGNLNASSQFEDIVSQLYDTIGQHKLALIHYKKSVILKDTIFSQENKKQLVQKEMNFEFDKKEAVTKAIAEEKSRKQTIITGFITGGLLLVLLFAGFIFRSLRVTKKQKIVIENQKQIVEEHQKEIIASITYAKRLQDAILPPIASIKKQFPESFVLYLPKDVVAGDFYWMETIDNIQFIAAADSTGHGVPGAMMSVVCSNALNRAVKEFGLRATGAILDKVTDLVLETFEKSGTDVKDGMDISILAFNRTNNSIQWSGANNPLWYTQNDKIIEIKPNKQPIGLCDNRKAFTTHQINYVENSLFYLFTDGYADQFGGTKGKKFMYRKFQENLLTIHTLPLEQQETALKTEFQQWKGSLEQVDDITVIGIKL